MALQQHVAAFDILQHLFGDALPQGQTVFDGKALNLLDHHPAAENLIRQQGFQHPLGLGDNHLSDAVAVDNADGDGFLLGEVHLPGVHIVYPLQLLPQQHPEGIHCADNLALPVDGFLHRIPQGVQRLFNSLFHYQFPSLVYSSRPPASKMAFCRGVRVQRSRASWPRSLRRVTKPVSMPW